MHLCGLKEPVAIETFRVATRQSRVAMIKSALRFYNQRVTEEETSNVLNALKNLDKLSSKRNQIAHGHVSGINETMDGNIVMRGNFLSSKLSPLGSVVSRESNRKYAYTAAEIDQWTDKVRQERGKIMDVCFAIIQRNAGEEE